MTHSRKLFIGAAIAALAAMTFGSGPAAAGICPPFDEEAAANGAVSERGEPFVGFTVLNRTGDDQQVFDQVEAGGKVPFFVLYENTDDVSHDIVLQGKLKGQVGDFRVKITTLESGKDVTAKVLGASGRKFHNVAADFASTPQLRVRINRHAGTPDTSELRIAFTGAFDQASVCGDTVKMKVNVPV